MKYKPKKNWHNNIYSGMWFAKFYVIDVMCNLKIWILKLNFTINQYNL